MGKKKKREKEKGEGGKIARPPIDAAVCVERDFPFRFTFTAL